MYVFNDPLEAQAREVVSRCAAKGCATCRAVTITSPPPLFAYALGERRDVLGAAADAAEDMRHRAQLEALRAGQ